MKNFVFCLVIFSLPSKSSIILLQLILFPGAKRGEFHKTQTVSQLSSFIWPGWVRELKEDIFFFFFFQNEYIDMECEVTATLVKLLRLISFYYQG